MSAKDAEQFQQSLKDREALIAALVPLFLIPDEKDLADMVASAIQNSFNETQIKTLIDDQLTGNSGEKALGVLLSNSALTAIDLRDWIQAHFNALAGMSRRWL